MSKKLVFVSVAIAMAGIHRDRLLLAFNTQWPEIQHLVSPGQIVSTDPLLTAGQINVQMDNSIFSIMTDY